MSGNLIFTTQDELERLAFANPGSEIVAWPEGCWLRLGRTRYFALEVAA